MNYKYTIHLGDSDYKGVVTLNGVSSTTGIDWSWNYSPDLIDKNTGYPHLFTTTSVDFVLMEIAQGNITPEDLDQGLIMVGMYGECRVKKHNV
tara:strand:- start:115 stop:393 length:279 start_codon:yes stop_codon:yes gene_type:complete